MKIIKIANVNEVFEESKKKALMLKEISERDGSTFSDYKLHQSSMSFFKDDVISKANGFISTAQIYSDGLTQGLKEAIETLNSGDVEHAKNLINDMTYSTEILEKGTSDARQFMQEASSKLQSGRYGG